jgi:serine/threonine protein phosphatase PrpC
MGRGGLDAVMAVEVLGRARLGGLLARTSEPRRCRVAAASRPGLLRRLRDAPSSDRHAVVLRPDLDYVMIAVFAGHGPHGSEIAELAAHTLSDVLEKRLLASPPSRPTDLVPKAVVGASGGSTGSSSASEDEGPLHVPIELAMQDAFVEANIAIDATPWAKHSGTTATVCVLRGGKLVVGSVGDCSLVLGRRRGGITKLTRLSDRHSVGLELEKERVERFGGVIHRGFISDESERTSLGVTRSLGDTEMRKSGVCQLPQIGSIAITHRDCIVALSTIPLWEDVNSVVAPPELAKVVNAKLDGPLEISQLLLETAFGVAGPACDATLVCMQLFR